jgi:hypothetical protein
MAQFPKSSINIDEYVLHASSYIIGCSNRKQLSLRTFDLVAMSLPPSRKKLHILIREAKTYHHLSIIKYSIVVDQHATVQSMRYLILCLLIKV